MSGMVGLLIAAGAWAAPPGWEVIQETDGIEVARKNQPDSSLYGFRGSGELALPIGVLVGLLLDHDRAGEWVELLQEHTVVRELEGEDAVVYEVYDMPWPVQDRDLVMRQTVTVEPESRTFILHFASVEDEGRPVDSCCVRSHAEQTIWTLHQLDDARTRVEVEVFGDPRGALPAWLVNLIQQDWPHKTISSLVGRAQHGDISPHPMVSGW